MKFLIDTNIVIPLEPTGGDFASNTVASLELAKYANLGAHQLFVHPEIQTDVDRDRDAARRATFTRLLSRYPALTHPPTVDFVEGKLGRTAVGSNGHVDNSLLAAVAADAVHYLVTEDGGIHRKAKKLGLDERVLTIAEATDLLRDLHDRTPRPPPYVEAIKAYKLNAEDPIFGSFREDYPDFDDCFARARKAHRDAWVIPFSDGLHAAVAIVKQEHDAVGLQGRVLKLCSFKVSDSANGSKFGELLLKTVFEHAYDNQYSGLYVTVFARHAPLISLFQQFGFERSGGRSALGEEVLVKRFSGIQVDHGLGALDYHVRFGPRAVRSFATQSAFVVPIQPAYHDALFPEASRQRLLGLEESKPFGNAIRKAYLCLAAIRKIAPGDNLLFYRSGDLREVQCTGVVESTRVSELPEEVAKFVGTRTVYKYTEIEELCRRGKVLAMLFRHSRVLNPALTYEQLVTNGVVKGPPQSIMSVSAPGLRWLGLQLPSQG